MSSKLSPNLMAMVTSITYSTTTVSLANGLIWANNGWFSSKTPMHSHWKSFLLSLESLLRITGRWIQSLFLGNLVKQSEQSANWLIRRMKDKKWLSMLNTTNLNHYWKRSGMKKEILLMSKVFLTSQVTPTHSCSNLKSMLLM